MLLPGLHPLARHDPKPFGSIDFRPSSADDLARPGCRQDRELQSARRNALLMTQLSNEIADPVIGQRREVPYTANLFSPRHEVFKMPAPPRRVLAFAITARCRPVNDRLNTTAHPARCFRLRVPDRLQRLHDEPDIDCLHGQVAEHGIDVGFQCRRPLRRMPRIAPTG